MKAIPLPATAFAPQPYAGPSAAQVLALREQYLNPGIFHYYRKPLMIVEGKMQWVWDDTGKRYLDGIGGIVTVGVGHCHPHVVAAAHTQNATLQHSTTPARPIPNVDRSVTTIRRPARNTPTMSGA